MAKSSSSGFCPIDVRNVIIPVTSSGKGTISKKHFCIYCKTLQSQFVRHLLSKHKDEEEVKKFEHLPAKDAKRRVAIEKLRKAGDHLHNTNEKHNTGIIITARRRSKDSLKNAEDYTACQSCKGFFSKTTIRFHARKCNADHKSGVKNIMLEGRRICGYLHSIASPKLRNEVFPVLREDDVVKCIRYDELIIKLGNTLCETYSSRQHHDQIRAHLRLLGKMKLALKNENQQFEEFKNIFKTKNIDYVMTAFMKVANWNSKTMKFDTPGTASIMSSLIKKCARIAGAQDINLRTSRLPKSIDNFLSLFDEKMSSMFNIRNRLEKEDKRESTGEILPSHESIKLLYDHLRNESVICINILCSGFDEPAWKHLNNCCLISIYLLNRRRASELEQLNLTNYQNKKSLIELIDYNKYQHLSELSFNFVKNFERLFFKLNSGHQVSVLFSPFDIQCLEVLLQYRSSAGIGSDNEYLFARHSSKQYLRVCPLLRRFASDCGATIPSSLRGIQLRKHSATFTAFLNVIDSDVSCVAHFMGHSQFINLENDYLGPVPLSEVNTVREMLTSVIGIDSDQDDGNSDDEDSGSSDEDNDSNDREGTQNVDTDHST